MAMINSPIGSKELDIERNADLLALYTRWLQLIIDPNQRKQYAEGKHYI